MDKIMEFLPFLIPLVIAEFALLGYTLHHILTHKNYKRGNRLYLSPRCGFASCEIGNKLTEEEQWAKLKLVKEIAEEVWG